MNAPDLKPDHPAKYFAIRKKGKIYLLEEKEVVYFQASGHYSRVHLKDGTTELHDKSLVQLMPILGEVYERVHRSYIVKMSEVRDIQVFKGGKYELELKNGDLIPMGRSKYKVIREKWLN